MVKENKNGSVEKTLTVLQRFSVNFLAQTRSREGENDYPRLGAEFPLIFAHY